MDKGYIPVSSGKKSSPPKGVPRQIWVSELEEDVPDPPVMNVIEDDEPVFTGLYDSSGNALYRVNHKIPVGFRNK